jgi:uncharacterized membrane protein
LENSFIVALFLRNEKLRRRKSNYLIASQALADVFLGLFAIPGGVMVYFELPRAHVPCICVLSMIRVARAISIFGIVAISVDRFKVSHWSSYL